MYCWWKSTGALCNIRYYTVVRNTKNSQWSNRHNFFVVNNQRKDLNVDLICGYTAWLDEVILRRSIWIHPIRCDLLTDVRYGPMEVWNFPLFSTSSASLCSLEADGNGRRSGRFASVKVETWLEGCISRWHSRSWNTGWLSVRAGRVQPMVCFYKNVAVLFRLKCSVMYANKNKM